MITANQAIYMYKKLNSVALVRERTIANERPPLFGEVSAYSRNFGFLNRSRYYFFQVASQLSSRG
jgi:hypothetical protein